MNFLTRGAIVWLVIIFAESVHGTLRTIFIAPAIGDFRSRQLGAVVASILVFIVALIFSRWINAGTFARRLAVGALWIGLTFTFEIVVGLYILGSDKERFLEDYDVLHGGLMPLALLFVLFTPVIAQRLLDLRRG